MEDNNLEDRTVYWIQSDFLEEITKIKRDYSILLRDVKAVYNEICIKDKRIRELELVAFQRYNDTEDYGPDLGGTSELVKFTE